MLIILYGPDTYRLKQRKNELVDRFKSKFGNFSIRSFDFTSETNTDPNELDSFLSGQSLFSSMHCCLINEPFTADLIKPLKKILFKIHDSNHQSVAIIQSSKKPPASLSALLTKPSQVEEFPLLAGTPKKQFILKLAKESNISLSQEVTESLLQNTSDSWQLINEMSKLSLLGKKEINLSDLSAIGLVKSYDFFYLLKALTDKDTSRRLSALEALTINKEPPEKIINSLAYNPSFSKIKVANADIYLKSGQLDSYSTLLNLIIS